jgi:uncharacterized protein YwgA
VIGLAGLIHLLERRGVFSFDVDDFDSKVKLQKYVYLSNYFGSNLDYNFNLYIHGPYSPDLAKDYYYLSENKTVVVEPLVDEKFFKLIEGKTIKWLEIATTYKLIKDKNPRESEDEIIRLVKIVKPFASERTINEISSEFNASFD